MRLILSNDIASITGTIGRGHGYYIQRRGDKFYGVRNSRGDVPKRGHWQFIKQCAQMAQNKMYFADILVTAEEMRSALREAGLWYGDKLAVMQKSRLLNANWVLYFTKRWAL